MTIGTPFDLWRASFEAWLNAWQVQISLGERLLAGMTAWQQVLQEPVIVSAEEPIPPASRRTRR
jgi:hypothetical protein